MGQCGKQGACRHVSNCERLPRQSAANVQTDCHRLSFVGLNGGRSSKKKFHIDIDTFVKCNWVDTRWQQYSAVQYSAVQCSAVQCSTVQCSAVQYSTVQYSTVQHNTVQYSTVQYSTVQYSTAQCSTVHIYIKTIKRTTQLTTLFGRVSGIRTQNGQTKINLLAPELFFFKFQHTLCIKCE